MREDGIVPNAASFASAISACGKALPPQPDEALLILDSMRRHDPPVEPTVVCFNAAIDACARGGDWMRALALLDTMIEAGIQPNNTSFNSTLWALERSGEWYSASTLLETMGDARHSCLCCGSMDLACVLVVRLRVPASERSRCTRHATA